MEIKILEEREEKLFGRKEITFEASYEGKTPSGEEVKQEICKKLGLSPDLTVVIKIDQAYGKGLSTVKVHSYAKKEVMEKIVRKPKEATAKKPEAPKPAPEPKEEKKEEKKEPAKDEKKKEHHEAEEKKEEKKEHKSDEKKATEKKEDKKEEKKE